MAEPQPIQEEHRILIEPYLRERVNDEIWSMRDEMFANVVYTQPGPVPYVTLRMPTGYTGPALQFSCITGEFMELTTWEYVRNLDVEQQTIEREEREYFELVASVLEYYHRIDFRATADYERTARNRTVNADATAQYGETIYEYNCPLQTIYLTEDHYPVSWEEQYVDEEQEWYMYNFDDDLFVSDLIETEDDSTNIKYRVPYEWKREEVGDA